MKATNRFGRTQFFFIRKTWDITDYRAGRQASDARFLRPIMGVPGGIVA